MFLSDFLARRGKCTVDLLKQKSATSFGSDSFERVWKERYGEAWRYKVNYFLVS